MGHSLLDYFVLVQQTPEEHVLLLILLQPSLKSFQFAHHYRLIRMEIRYFTQKLLVECLISNIDIKQIQYLNVEFIETVSPQVM